MTKALRVLQFKFSKYFNLAKIKLLKHLMGIFKMIQGGSKCYTGNVTNNRHYEKDNIYDILLVFKTSNYIFCLKVLAPRQRPLVLIRRTKRKSQLFNKTKLIKLLEVKNLGLEVWKIWKILKAVHYFWSYCIQ